MDILTLGPWVLLLFGAGALGAAVRSFMQPSPQKALTIFFALLGVLLAGLGVYGPAFMKDYGDFLHNLQPLLKMEESPTPQSYGAFFRKVGSGELPPEYQELGLAYALDRPIPGMDRLLEEAISSAKDPAGRRALEETRQALAGKQYVASRLIASLHEVGAPPAEALRKFDPATVTLIAIQLKDMPKDRIGEMKIDPEVIDKLAAPRQTRTKAH